MAAEVFADCVFFLKVNHLPAQDKKRLKAIIKDKGGTISFLLNEKCTHVITEDTDALTSRHLQNIKKNHIPIVGVDFIMNLVNKMTGCCEVLPEKLDTSSALDTKKETHNHDKEHGKTFEKSDEKEKKKIKKRVYIESDPDHVNFHQEFEVAKYAVLEKTLASLPNEVAVIELHCLTGQFDLPFQIAVHLGLSNGLQSKLNYLQFETSEEACERYHLCAEDLKKKDYKLRKGVPQDAVHLASEKLQEMLLQDAINATSVSLEISTFVELIWVEALGHLDHILLHPVNSISLNDVSKAEGVLLQVRKALDKGDTTDTLRPLMCEFYRIIRHKNEIDLDVNKKLLSTKEALCQVIRDIVSVCETNLSSPNPPSLAKYHALRCMIQYVNPNSDEFLQVKEQVLQSNHSGSQVAVLNIYRIGRINEAVEFESNLGNLQLLMHASAACNYVGILSRGLLLPKVVVEDHGVERTDIGNLGSGIYFTDSISTSMKYSAPTQTDGSRLLVVCDVALGNCLDLNKKDFSLTNAPPGYHSVHGIRKASDLVTDFEDDEYVVYNTSQIKMKYVVQFCTTEDNIKDFCPNFNIAEGDANLEDHSDLPSQTDDNDTLDIKPLKEVKAGLLDNSGNPIPLEGIHIKGKILDLIAQVVVFQSYTNRSAVPIEAKYVFPLDSTAAVCGFEAFINGKHIIGEVKEKEEAHRDYREAVSKGHGAYLMDQDAPDVFTVSVGNLPPQATVIIKITYVTELSIMYGTVLFMIPGAVAPWQEDKALNENTQDTVEKICVKEGDAKQGAFSLDLSIEMPFKIDDFYCETHTIKLKKTDCKAVITTEENSTFDSNGFNLRIGLTDTYLPRMWVEKHPDKESEACMLVFQPDFDTESEEPEFNEVIICLDCSNSMSTAFQQAKKIALLTLDAFSGTKAVNIIKFGTSYEEFCSYSRRYSDLELLKKFIKSAKPTMGNTDFWKPLHSLSLLAPSKGIRNILLISDGHIQDESRTFQIVKNNVKHTRLFTCGVGSTVNHHMLRSLAKYGAGAFEYFDAKSKYNWMNKVTNQMSRMDSEGCNSVSVKWQQFNQNSPEPIQAPAEIQSIFRSERVLVYGFVPRCTQATLRALLRNQEIDTMVSTTELQKTKGTILHKLTARALIRDYEDGIFHEKENEHEMKKQMLKSMIIELSKEYSIVTQFTSFVAIEKRDALETQVDIPNIVQLLAAEDVDFLPYMTWKDVENRDWPTDSSSDSMEDGVAEGDLMGFGLFDDNAMEDEDSDLLGGFGLFDDNAKEDEDSDLLGVVEDVCVDDEAWLKPVCELQVPAFAGLPCSRKVSLPPTPEGALSALSPSEPAPPSFAPVKRFLSNLQVPPGPPPPPLPQALLEPLRDVTPAQPPSYHPTAPCFLQTPVPYARPPAPYARPPAPSGRRSLAAAPPVFGQAAPCPAPFLAPKRTEFKSSFGFSQSSVVGAELSDYELPLSNAFPFAAVIKPQGATSFGADSEPRRPLAAAGLASYSGLIGTPAGPASYSGLFGTPAGPASYSGLFGTPAGPASYSGLFGHSPQKEHETPAGPASYSGLFGTPAGPASYSSLFGHSPQKDQETPMMFGSSPGSICFSQTKMKADAVEVDTSLDIGLSLRNRAMATEESTSFSAVNRRAAKVSNFVLPTTEIELSQEIRRKRKMKCYAMTQETFKFDEMHSGFGSHAKQWDQIRDQSDQDESSVPKLIWKYKADPNWAHLFLLQTQDHYWELNSELEMALKVDVNVLINVFLAQKGLNSLGPKGKEVVLRLIATLLVLQALHQAEELSGIRFKSLMKLDESSIKNDNYWRLCKATEWARKTDRQYPGICSRLELGKDWNSATRQLLGIDPIEDSAPLAKAGYAR